MQIGIITFQRVENYGAALQCRALYCYLKSLGHDVKIIDYKNDSMERRYRLFPPLRKNLVKLASRDLFIMLNIKDFKNKKRKFWEFFSFLPTTERLTRKTLKMNGLEYDLVIAGSDQLWNSTITRGFDEIYFLQFPGNFIRATYAISAGTAPFLSSSDSLFDEYIKSFDFISAREKILAEYIEHRLGHKVLRSVDPTLLIAHEEWEKMIAEVKMELPPKYILMYGVKEIGELSDISSELSHKYGATVICLNPGWNFALKRKSIGYIKMIDAGPLEFIYLIKNAYKITTSSFHGTVSSCIFRKDIYIYMPEKNGDARLEDIAEMFGITNRIFCSYMEFCERKDDINDIVYDTSIYDSMRAESVKYLNEVTA